MRLKYEIRSRYMYDYIIATSSTSDLPRTYLEAHNIPFIPYTYTIGNDL